MTTNAKMTYFHKTIQNHEEVWLKGFVDGVMWQEKVSVNPDTGYREVSEVNVYIPTLLDDINKEDIIVKGETDAISPYTLSKYYTVTSVINCDYGSREMQHTELVGK